VPWTLNGPAALPHEPLNWGAALAGGVVTAPVAIAANASTIPATTDRAVVKNDLHGVNCAAEPQLLGGARSTEMPGFSCFLREGDEIFHTYSTYGRGADHTIGTYALLDLTALGRQEDWEEPKGRVAAVRGGDPTFSS
jgi:predicted dithiol-disulfide oxidoreductase (DUF899 family)